MSFIPNTTPTPNILYDDILKETSDTELRVLLLIIRKTLGWVADTKTGNRKTEDWISQKLFMNATGKSNRAISTAIQSCIDKKWIQARDKDGNILLDSKSRQSRKNIYYRILNLETSEDDNITNKETSENSSLEPVKIVHSTKETLTKESIYINIYTNLSEQYGKTSLNRIINFYSKIWYSLYGTKYIVTNQGLIRKQIKGMLENLTEYQLSALIITHFNWYGASGTDEFTHNRLKNAFFPLSWIATNINSYKAYLVNAERLKFDHHEVLKAWVDRYTDSL